MSNPYLLMKIASDLNLSINRSGEIYKVLKKLEDSNLSLEEKALIEESSSYLIQETIMSLNQLKRIKLTIKILKQGTSITNLEDLNSLKKYKIESLIDFDEHANAKVIQISENLELRNNYVNDLNNKTELEIIKEYKLMPNTILVIFIMFILCILSFVGCYIGYYYLNLTQAFWCILLNIMLGFISFYYLFKNIFIKLKEIKNKDELNKKIVRNFIFKKEKNLEKNEKLLIKERFKIEKKSIVNGSLNKYEEILIEEKIIREQIKKNFN